MSDIDNEDELLGEQIDDEDYNEEVEKALLEGDEEAYLASTGRSRQIQQQEEQQLVTESGDAEDDVLDLGDTDIDGLDEDDQAHRNKIEANLTIEEFGDSEDVVDEGRQDRFKNERPNTSGHTPIVFDREDNASEQTKNDQRLNKFGNQSFRGRGRGGGRGYFNRQFVNNNSRGNFQNRVGKPNNFRQYQNNMYQEQNINQGQNMNQNAFNQEQRNQGFVNQGQFNQNPIFNQNMSQGQPIPIAHESKKVLINPHFRGNIQPRPDARLRWDPTAQTQQIPTQIMQPQFPGPPSQQMNQFMNQPQMNVQNNHQPWIVTNPQQDMNSNFQQTLPIPVVTFNNPPPQEEFPQHEHVLHPVQEPGPMFVNSPHYNPNFPQGDCSNQMDWYNTPAADTVSSNNTGEQYFKIPTQSGFRGIQRNAVRTVVANNAVNPRINVNLQNENEFMRREQVFPFPQNQGLNMNNQVLVNPNFPPKRDLVFETQPMNINQNIPSLNIPNQGSNMPHQMIQQHHQQQQQQPPMIQNQLQQPINQPFQPAMQQHMPYNIPRNQIQTVSNIPFNNQNMPNQQRPQFFPNNQNVQMHQQQINQFRPNQNRPHQQYQQRNNLSQNNISPKNSHVNQSFNRGNLNRKQGPYNQQRSPQKRNNDTAINETQNKKKKSVPDFRNLQEVPTVDMPDTTTTVEERAPENEDEETREYRMKIEQQKREREEYLRQKEERRIRKATTLNQVSSESINNVTQSSSTNIVNRQQNTVNSTTPVSSSKTQSFAVSRQNVNVQHAKVNQAINRQNLKVVSGKPDAIASSSRGIIRPKNNIVNKNIAKPIQTLLKSNAINIANRQNVAALNTPNRTVVFKANAQVSSTQPNTPRTVSVVKRSNVANEVRNKDHLTSSFLSTRIVVPKTPITNGPLSNITAGSPIVPLVKTAVVSISNLAAGTSENKLRQMCKGVGRIQNIEMIPATRQATIKFKNVLSAHNFFSKYQRKMVDLSLINVELVPID